MNKSTPLRAVAEVADDAIAGPALAPGQGRFGDGEPPEQHSISVVMPGPMRKWHEAVRGRALIDTDGNAAA